MLSYLKLALKVLRRRKVFTFISLFGIALTLAVLMVATTVIDNVFAPLAPETRLDRTLCVFVLGQHGPGGNMWSNPGYKFLDENVRTLPGIERASIYSEPQTGAIYRNGARIDAVIKRTDGAYWQILDFRFLEGHPFSADDDANGVKVAVISDDMREKLFDGNSAVGRTLEFDGSLFRIVGVVPRVSLTRLSGYSDIWIPIGTSRSSEYRSQMFGPYNGIVLVRDRADIPALKREFNTRVSRIPLADPKTFNVMRSGLDTPFEAVARMLFRNEERGALIVRLILIVAALLFMTLPALNLVTLNLSRILERAPEIGVRRAFGAPRRSLVTQFIVENVVLTVIGGLIAFVIAAMIIPVIGSLIPFPGAVFTLNVRIFVYGMLLAVLFGVLSGFYPAWRMSRLQPVNALRGGER